MVRDIAEGYLLLTERSFQRMRPEELHQLGFELERRVRAVRGTQPAIDDTAEVQARQRRLQRLTGAQRMLRAYRVKRKT